MVLQNKQQMAQQLQEAQQQQQQQQQVSLRPVPMSRSWRMRLLCSGGEVFGGLWGW